ncbi:MAG: AAA family ATPase [Microcoleaceae cyanobacterium]
MSSIPRPDQSIPLQVQCLSCSVLNPQGAKFCMSCGLRLQQVCPQCQWENLPQAQFCIECGISLTQKLAVTVSSRSHPRPAERRQLTVMFCDLVGSTTLSEQLDPEELRELIQTYQETCAEAVMKFGGYIAQYLGDGILIYFGYPIAHEDDAQRSVRAALGIIDSIRNLKFSCKLASVQSHTLDLSVRLGIHTGLVVVGEVGAGNKREQLAIGQTPNIAARLQGLAQPNTVVLSPTTHRMVQDIFEFQSLGEHSLKGVSQPVELYQALQEAGYCKRMKVAASHWTPYVGREAELEQLKTLWERAKSGQEEVVLLIGEAGIGKSRLVQEFRQAIATDSYALREVHCSSYHQNTPFYPIAEMFRTEILHLERQDSAQTQLEKVEQFLHQTNIPLEAGVPLLAQLLSIPLDERYPALNLSPLAQKQKLLKVLLTLIQQVASQQPLLVVVEDMQWIDPSTLELIEKLIEMEDDARYPILRIYTSRPGLRFDWSNLTNFTPIILNHFPAQQMERMIQGVTHGKSLPDAVQRLLIDKSDGVPLFVEEMTKMVIESGWLQETETAYELTAPFPPSLMIPDTLQGMLMERLDHLGTAKEVAQLGSTIGREFSYELIRAITLQALELQGEFNERLDESTIIQGLDRLVETRLLFMTGELPVASYIFRSVLIQDAAYDSLLKSTRQQYHHRIANVLEGVFPEIVQREPELLAYHYDRAGLPEQAVPYWQQAGQLAFEKSANEEAIVHLKSGLTSLGPLLQSPEWIQPELNLQILLGKALITIKGYAAPEVEQVFRRSQELCQQLGSTPQLFGVLWGLFGYHIARAEHQTALEIGSRLMGLARRFNDPTMEMEAHFNLGLALLYVGRLQAAQEHWLEAIKLQDRFSLDCRTCFTGQDVGVSSYTFLSWSSWLLGLPDIALRYSKTAIALAHERSHPYSTCLAVSMGAVFHEFRQDQVELQQEAERAIALAQEQQFNFWLALGTIMQGWSKVVNAPDGLHQDSQHSPLLVAAQMGSSTPSIEAGIAQLRQGIADHRATGARISQTYFLGLLAQAYARAGQVTAGLAVLEEALQAVENTYERFWEAELYRLKGTLLQALEKKADPLSPIPDGAASASPTSASPTSKSVVPESIISAPTSMTPEFYFQKALEIARHQGAKSLESRAAISLAQFWQQQGQVRSAQDLLQIYQQSRGVANNDSVTINAPNEDPAGPITEP